MHTQDPLQIPPKPLEAIAAMGLNRVIGREGRLPWHISEDLKEFKRRTMGHILLMGRKTWESLGRRPLPGRETIVLSSTLPDNETGCRVIRSLAELPGPEDARTIWVCGGAELYRLALPWCSRLYLTLVQQNAEGDCFMPPFEELFEKGEMVWEVPGCECTLYDRKGDLPFRKK